MKFRMADGWLFHRAGSWTLVVLGLGHVLTHLLSPKTPEQERILQVMREFTVAMPGYSSNLLLFHNGFSLTMGGLLIFYGTINLILAGFSVADPGKALRIAILNVAVSVFILAMSVTHFFIVPVIFSLMSLTSFGAFLLVSTRAGVEKKLS